MSSPRVLAAAAVLSLVCAIAPLARGQTTNPLFTPIVQANQPIFVTDPGDGRLFIVERAGYIRIFANGVLQPRDATAFLDIHAVVNTSGEGGLTSMAFDPDFASNKRVYVMYTRDIDPSSAVLLQSVVARYAVSGADPNRVDYASAKEMLTLDAPGTAYTNHKGGQLQFGPDDMLYIGFGDGGSADDPGCRSQMHNVLFGKILRIDPHGTGLGVGGVGYGLPSSPSNPFASDPNYAPEIWLLGLRNPWRFSFDRTSGDLWIADVGQNAREEIDLLPAGASGGENYGWNVVEGTIARPGGNGMPIGSCPSYVKAMNDPNADYTPPIFDYDHNGGGASITGGYVYRGSAAAWQGRYFYADYVTKEIRYLEKNGSTWDSTLISDGDLAGPASFGEDSNGELYVADLNTGWVYRFDLAAATALNKAQVACVTGLNEGFAKLANTGGKLVKACVAKAQKGAIATGAVGTCAGGDAKLTKVAGKNAATDAKKCGSTPPLGYAGAAAGNAAASGVDLESAVLVLGVGDDLGAGLVTKSADKNAAGCQKAVLGGLTTCLKVRRAEFVRCKKAGLKKGNIASAAQLADCLASDPKGKVAKACDGTTGKLAAKTIEKSCVARGVDLSTAFPNCGTADAGALAQCIEDTTACQSCLMFRQADALLDGACDAVCP